MLVHWTVPNQNFCFIYPGLHDFSCLIVYICWFTCKSSCNVSVDVLHRDQFQLNNPSKNTDSYNVMMKRAICKRKKWNYLRQWDLATCINNLPKTNLSQMQVTNFENKKIDWTQYRVVDTCCYLCVNLWFARSRCIFRISVLW